MFYLLFTIYLLLLSLVIHRIPFIKRSGLSRNLVSALLLIKIAAGLFIGWMSQKYYPQGNDYWNINRDGQEEYQLLINDPLVFIKSLFISPYENAYGGFFNSVGSYWKDLGYNFIIKLLAVFNIFSRGNFYINTMFLCAMGFIGHVALYRVFIHVYSNSKWPVIAGCFLIPSALYFSSGLHRDQLIFLSLCLFCYGFYFAVNDKVTVKRFLLIIAALAGLLIMRNYIFIALLPPAFAMVLAKRNTQKTAVYFIAVYSLIAILILLISFTGFSPDPLEIIVNKQQDFLQLPVAATHLQMDTLSPTPGSFIKAVPQALQNAFLHPYPGEFRSFFLLAASVELFIYILLAGFILLRYNKIKNYRTSSFSLFAISFSLTLILFAGYIVPNAGSLLRYRSLYLPFILTPLFVNIWLSLKHIENKNI